MLIKASPGVRCEHGVRYGYCIHCTGTTDTVAWEFPCTFHGDTQILGTYEELKRPACPTCAAKHQQQRERLQGRCAANG